MSGGIAPRSVLHTHHHALTCHQVCKVFPAVPPTHCPQGSTTVLWQQQSFWDRRPAASSDVLPLFVEKGLSMLGAALGVATGSSAEAQTAKYVVPARAGGAGVGRV